MGKEGRQLKKGGTSPLVEKGNVQWIQGAEVGRKKFWGPDWKHVWEQVGRGGKRQWAFFRIGWD